MAFCAQCGKETQGDFCPACGAPASPTSTAQNTPQAAPLEDHIASALCYFLMPLTGVLFLVLDPYKSKREVRFHAIQSILAAAAIYAGFLALTFLAFMPFVGLLFSMVTLLYPVLAFGLWAYLMLKTYNKERIVLPMIGQLAESQA